MKTNISGDKHSKYFIGSIVFLTILFGYFGVYKFSDYLNSSYLKGNLFVNAVPNTGLTVTLEDSLYVSAGGCLNHTSDGQACVIMPIILNGTASSELFSMSFEFSQIPQNYINKAWVIKNEAYNYMEPDPIPSFDYGNTVDPTEGFLSLNDIFLNIPAQTSLNQVVIGSIYFNIPNLSSLPTQPFSFDLVSLTLVNANGATYVDLWDDPHQITVSVTAAPNAPTITSLTPGTTAVSMNWVKSTTGGEPTSYSLYKGGVAVSTVAAIPNTNTYNYTGLSANSSYSFSVKAINSAGSSAMATSTVMTLPNGVTSFTTTNITANSISLSWAAPTIGGAHDYLVTATPGSLTSNTTANITTFNSLTPSTGYSFTIVARNSNGGASAPMNITATTGAGFSISSITLSGQGPTPNPAPMQFYAKPNNDITATVAMNPAGNYAFSYVWAWNIPGVSYANQTSTLFNIDERPSDYFENAQVNLTVSVSQGGGSAQTSSIAFSIIDNPVTLALGNPAYSSTWSQTLGTLGSTVTFKQGELSSLNITYTENPAESGNPTINWGCNGDVNVSNPSINGTGSTGTVMLPVQALNSQVTRPDTGNATANPHSCSITYTPASSGGEVISRFIPLHIANVNDNPIITGPFNFTFSGDGDNEDDANLSGNDIDFDLSAVGVIETMTWTVANPSVLTGPIWSKLSLLDSSFSDQFAKLHWQSGFPSQGQSGTLALQIYVKDSKMSQSTTATLNLTVSSTNYDPTINTTPPLIYSDKLEDETYTFTINPNNPTYFTDANGDTLKWIISNTPSSGISSASVVQSTGAFTVIPNANFNNTSSNYATFNAKVCDPSNACTGDMTFKFAWGAVNDLPVINDSTFETYINNNFNNVFEDSSGVSLNLLTHALDEETSQGSLVWNIVFDSYNSPYNSTVNTLLTSSTQITGSSTQKTITPPSDWNGNIPFLATVSDTQGGSDSKSFTINFKSVDDPAVFQNYPGKSGTSPVQVKYGSGLGSLPAYSFPLTANITDVDTDVNLNQYPGAKQNIYNYIFGNKPDSTLPQASTFPYTATPNPNYYSYNLIPAETTVNNTYNFFVRATGPAPDNKTTDQQFTLSVIPGDMNYVSHTVVSANLLEVKMSKNIDVSQIGNASYTFTPSLGVISKSLKAGTTDTILIETATQTVNGAYSLKISNLNNGLYQVDPVSGATFNFYGFSPTTAYDMTITSAQALAGNSSVFVKMNNDVNQVAISSATIFLSPPATINTRTYSSLGEFTLGTSALIPSTQYTLSISGLNYNNHATSGTVTRSFTSLAQGQTYTLGVVSASSINNTTVDVTFNKNISASSLGSATFTFAGGSGLTATTWSLQTDTKVRVTTSSQSAVNYTVTVGGNIKATDGDMINSSQDEATFTGTAQSTILYGDCDGNGDKELNDVLQALYATVTQPGPTSPIWINCNQDIYYPNEINMNDVLAAYEAVMGN